MVISGKARGDANQLANYLLTKGENENITILDVDGRAKADAASFKDLLHSMELNSELTRSKQSVYHAFINPNPTLNEDRTMTADEWRKSAEVLGKELGLEDQRRVIVLHEKKGRIHAHVVFERYDHGRGKMIDYKHNYLAHDKARAQLEKELKHERTPQKNLAQPNHKIKLTALWNETQTGAQFIKKAKENGYLISKGTDRPFRVVDSNGRSFDLARQLDKIKTKDIRQRMENINLIDDKQAIQRMALLKIQKQTSKEVAATEASTPLNNKKMNWKNLLNDNKLSLSEIRARHEAKKELLQEQSTKIGITAKEWYENKQAAEKLNKAFEEEMSQQLDNLYNYDQVTTAFPENKQSITKEKVPSKEIESLMKKQADEITAQEKAKELQRRLREMFEEAERKNRDNSLKKER